MFFNERALLFPHRVVLVHSFRLVVVVIEECRLVRDDQILPVRRRPLQNVQCRHHRHRDSRHTRLRIPRFEGIHGLRFPWDANMFLDRRCHFPGCRPLFLRLCSQAPHSSSDQSRGHRRAQQCRSPNQTIHSALGHSSSSRQTLRYPCSSPSAYSGFFAGPRNFTWAILPRIADRVPAPFALTRAPIDASIALPRASARASSPPSIPPRDTCGLPQRESTAEFSFLSRFLSAKISAFASTDSGRLPAVPARKAPSKSEKAGGLAARSSLRALKHPRAPRGLQPLSQKCCVPVPPPALLSPRSEAVPASRVFPASSKPVAATDLPNLESPAAPTPGSPDTRALAAPPAN